MVYIVSLSGDFGEETSINYWRTLKIGPGTNTMLFWISTTQNYNSKASNGQLRQANQS